MYKVNFEVKISKRIQDVLHSLKPTPQKQLSSKAMDGIVSFVSKHIYKYAQTHHKSARRLSATPTGHLEKASRSVRKRGMTFSVTSAGFRRVLHPLNIRAKNKPHLTIPISAISYGKWFKQLPASVRNNSFRPYGTDIIAWKPRWSDTFIPLYALKKSVVVPQEPKLLPTKRQIARAFSTAFVTAFNEHYKTRTI